MTGSPRACVSVSPNITGDRSARRCSVAAMDLTRSESACVLRGHSVAHAMRGILLP
jgi:hypothetical protein